MPFVPSPELCSAWLSPQALGTCACSPPSREHHALPCAAACPSPVRQAQRKAAPEYFPNPLDWEADLSQAAHAFRTEINVTNDREEHIDE